MGFIVFLSIIMHTEYPDKFEYFSVTVVIATSPMSLPMSCLLFVIFIIIGILVKLARLMVPVWGIIGTATEWLYS